MGTSWQTQQLSLVLSFLTSSSLFLHPSYTRCLTGLQNTINILQQRCVDAYSCCLDAPWPSSSCLSLPKGHYLFEVNINYIIYSYLWWEGLSFCRTFSLLIIFCFYSNYYHVTNQKLIFINSDICFCLSKQVENQWERGSVQHCKLTAYSIPGIEEFTMHILNKRISNSLHAQNKRLRS